VGSTPPPIPRASVSPSISPMSSPKPTQSLVVDPTQTGLAGQWEKIGINQSAYTYCGYGKTTSGANSNGFTAATKITVKRGDVSEVAISIIGIPRRVIWRFTPDTQVGFNSGAGDFGTLTVNECKATYTAPSVTSNPTVSLLVDVHAGVNAETKAPSPSPSLSPRCTKCPFIGAPNPLPSRTSSSPGSIPSNANAEQGPSAVGWLANDQIYSRWSIGNHRVYITDGSGRVLVNRIYSSSCTLTQIKFG